MSNFARDVRYAWRTLARQPMLLAAATASIGLGVAANLSVYALANDLLLSVPSAQRPQELVHVRTGNGSHVSYPAWRALDGSGVLNGLAGYSIEVQLNWRNGDQTVPVTPLIVTPNYFGVVGVPVGQGRGFSASDVARDAHLAVVTNAFGRRAFGDASPVGQSLTLNGTPYTVVGVLPSGARSLPGYGITPDLYIPASPDVMPEFERALEPAVQLVGRLHDGQSHDQARQAIAAVALRVGEAHGDDEIGQHVAVSSIGGLDQIRDFAAVGAFFGVLLVVSGLVLLIACANVAGLLVARSVARRREIGLRLALGASRGRLLQQLLSESLVLSVFGTVAGLGLAWIAALALAGVSLPLPIPIRMAPVFDVRLLSAAGALVLVTTFLCGLMPALQATHANLLPAIRQDAAIAISRRFSLRRVLVVGQVTVSVLLLVVALLFVQNLRRSTALEPGFDVDRLLVAQMTFVEGRQGPAEARAIVPIVERLRAMPGVEAAAFADGVPLTLMSGSWNGTDLRLGGDPETTHVEFARNLVGPDYFRTMGIPVRGREFTAADRPGAPRVTIINEAFAKRYFPQSNPVGLTIDDPREGGARTIVGVAANSKYRMIGEDDSPAIFDPLLQSAQSTRLVHALVRAPGATGDTIAAVRASMLAADDAAAVTVEPMSSALAFAFLPSRIGAALLGTLGALGTVLAMVGLYGILSFTVGRRTREIGLRLSLGAPRAAVVRLVLGEATLLVGVGVAMGLGLALFVTQPLAAFLVAGLEPADPATFAATLLLLVVTSLLAAWSPARRALKIDPYAALKEP